MGITEKFDSTWACDVDGCDEWTQEASPPGGWVRVWIIGKGSQCACPAHAELVTAVFERRTTTTNRIPVSGTVVMDRAAPDLHWQRTASELPPEHPRRVNFDRAESAARLARSSVPSVLQRWQAQPFAVRASATLLAAQVLCLVVLLVWRIFT